MRYATHKCVLSATCVLQAAWPQAVGKLFMDDLTQALSLLFANEHLSLEHYATLIDMAESHGNEVQSAWATRAMFSRACNDCRCSGMVYRRRRRG